MSELAERTYQFREGDGSPSTVLERINELELSDMGDFVPKAQVIPAFMERISVLLMLIALFFGFLYFLSLLLHVIR